MPLVEQDGLPATQQHHPRQSNNNQSNWLETTQASTSLEKRHPCCHLQANEHRKAQHGRPAVGKLGARGEGACGAAGMQYDTAMPKSTWNPAKKQGHQATQARGATQHHWHGILQSRGLELLGLLPRKSPLVPCIVPSLLPTLVQPWSNPVASNPVRPNQPVLKVSRP